MGSLPELRRLGASSPSPPPPTRQMYSAPRHSVGAATTMQVRKTSAPRQPINIEGVTSVQGMIVGGRRRESCTSSAASVRRLVRTGTAGVGGTMVVPTAMTIRAAAAACLARAFAAAAFLPLQVLQGAHGLWSPGVPLLAGLHASAALAALGAPALLHLATIRRLMPVTYFLLAIFFAAHLYPKVYILVPAYLAVGALWSPLTLAHSALLTSLVDGGFRNTGGGNSCVLALPARKALLRRMSRASRAARDLGLLLAAMLLPFLPISSNTTDRQLYQPDYIRNSTNCALESGNGSCKLEALHGNSSLAMDNSFSWPNVKSNVSQVNLSSEVWSASDSEDELDVWRENWCGARACPGQELMMDREMEQEGAGGGTALALWLCSCCLLAAVCSLALPSTGAKAGPAPWKAAINALSETRLRLVAPLAFFIGLEQGFLYAHLMQWYVVCVSGAGQSWRALVGVALLRALVACTLSMLLAHGRRRLVVAVGLMWHACLLLALFMWRAARADKQLPPVMAAAWAGCDAVWELVQATLIDEPWCSGLSALSLSLRAAGLSISLTARWLLCAQWSLKGLMLALPAAAIPLLFAPDR